ncbi:hypothetical protein ACFPDQ_02425 [Pseudofrancisella aestuarii]|uniref:Uncharacterized protein n=1 Tax=Pseudofrancisella aestuarii TaxID=2670347 RepID=A0ABV9TAQ9_9GAMM|nr:hypothetical protein [Pseudofrancisella aestuarii]
MAYIIGILSFVLPFLFIINIVLNRKSAWLFLVLANSIPVILAFLYMQGQHDYMVYTIVETALYMSIYLFGYINFIRNNKKDFESIKNKQKLFVIFLFVLMCILLECFIAKGFYYTMFKADPVITAVFVLEDIVSIFGLILIAKHYRDGLLIFALYQMMVLLYSVYNEFFMVNYSSLSSYVMLSVNIVVILLGVFLLVKKYIRTR